MPLTISSSRRPDTPDTFTGSADLCSINASTYVADTINSLNSDNHHKLKSHKMETDLTHYGMATLARAAPDSEVKRNRSKRNRLLILRHITLCDNKSHKGCLKMKNFCHHISQCHNKYCQVPDCVSSRYVISHYRRCKDMFCPVCAPTRDTLKRIKAKQDLNTMRDMSMSSMGSYFSLPDYSTPQKDRKHKLDGFMMNIQSKQHDGSSNL